MMVCDKTADSLLVFAGFGTVYGLDQVAELLSVECAEIDAQF
jgi:hypothetical protein